jgi:uncharacterized OB-fold protein
MRDMTESASRTARPEPMYLNWYDDGFRAACAAGEFRLLQCRPCKTVVFPAGPVCPSCLSDDLSWETMSGKGTLHSWVRFHRQYFAEIPPPYECGSVALAEGPLFITALHGFDELTTAAVGMNVELRMVEFATGALPIAFPASPSGEEGE